MNESLIRQADQADLAYREALEHNAPAVEQARLLELWCRLYCQATRDEALLTPSPSNILPGQQPPPVTKVNMPHANH